MTNINSEEINIEGKLNNIDININCSLGSDFQEKYSLNSLLGILDEWKKFIISNHKKNKIDLKIKINK